MLETVDKPADAPRPHTVRPVLLKLRVQPVHRLVAPGLGVAHHSRERETHYGYIPAGEYVAWQAAGVGSHSYTYHQRMRTLGLRNLERAVHRDALTVDAHLHNQQGVALERGLGALLRGLRLPAHLIFIEFGHDFVPSPLPLGELLHASAAVRPFQRVRKGSDAFELVESRQYRLFESRAGVFVSIYKRRSRVRCAGASKRTRKQKGDENLFHIFRIIVVARSNVQRRSNTGIASGRTGTSA